MNPPTEDLLQQLKQSIIKQKSIHLEKADESSKLFRLYHLLYQYDEHVSKLVLLALQQTGDFTAFALMASLQSEIQKSDNQTDPDNQRLFNHYRVYKQRLDKIYWLVNAILTNKKNGEQINGG